MAIKKKFERTKEHVNIGTIGHVDHGKTTFSAAITSVSSKLGYGEAVSFEKIDNAPEEKARGITIKASTIEFDTEKRHYSLTDCPGHADYIKNMITGASAADILILLISATDGTMQQTKEHILLAKQINVKNLIIFINKIDALDDPDMIDIVKEEAADLAKDNDFPNPVVLTGSALGALNGEAKYEEGIKAVMDALDAIPLPPREIDKPFVMPVEGLNSIPGRGTVVTGKIEKGVIKPGDQVDIISRKEGVFKATVTGAETFNKELDQAQAGDNVGLLLRNISLDRIGRGDILCAPGTIKPHTHFKAEVYIIPKSDGGRKNPFKAKYRPQFFFRTADITGTINKIYAQEGGALEEKEIAMPGDRVTLEIELIHATGMDKGLQFAIREGKRTIGAGVVTEIIK